MSRSRKASPLRMTQASLLSFFACAALCACTVGPNFKRPATPRPAKYLPAAEQQGETAPGEASPSGVATGGVASAGSFAQRVDLGGTPSAEWWTGFRSPPLDALIRQAVADNHSLAAARATLAEARELVKVQAGARFPQVDYDGGMGRQKYGKEFLGSEFVLPPFSYLAAGATVSYTLDYMGGVTRSIEQQRALAQYERSEADATYLALTGSVVTQAMAAAAAQAEIAAISELIGEDRNNLKLVRTEYADGAVSRVDVLTAESQLASDETLLPPVRQRLVVAQHALAVLIGRAPAGWTAPKLALSDLELPRNLPVSLPSELVHRRPDILAAEAELHAATAAVGIATANLYPRITLTATGGFQTVPFQQLFTASNEAWTLIAGITGPVFHGGTLHAERRAAVDELRASAQRYQQVVLDAFGQVADLLDALNHDSQLIAAQTNALSAAASSVELARESYRAGNSGLLEVLDAQRQRLAAQLGVVRAEAQQYVDTAQLYLALGGRHFK
jgi:NodT family efflux transporter outer membrane factor (OMF) lipoprotein